jgi:two-component system chemotaxis sensor kinase CheA
MASILIVDDSLPCRNVTAALLRAAGHRVNCADNAWRGLTILESMPIDLVILDLLLPGLNGFGFLKDVQNGKHREMPVIVATSLDKDEALWQQGRPQVRRWLIKGQYSGEDLIEAVNGELPMAEAESVTSAA